MKWNPISKRKRGRPKTRWTTDLVKHSGNNWAGMAEDRDLWSSGREAFVQQWNRDGCNDDDDDDELELERG